RLRSFDLRGVDLSCRDLRGADFSGLDLPGACFRDANLRGAVFHDADLSQARLKEAHCLSVDALGGADLTSAELPADVAQFPELAAVADVASYVQSLFKLTLVLAMFVAITMASARDPELLNTNGTGSMKLPLLDAPMPTFWFNWIGPFMLLVV